MVGLHVCAWSRGWGGEGDVITWDWPAVAWWGDVVMPWRDVICPRIPQVPPARIISHPLRSVEPEAAAAQGCCCRRWWLQARAQASHQNVPWCAKQIPLLYTRRARRAASREGHSWAAVGFHRSTETERRALQKSKKRQTNVFPASSDLNHKPTASKSVSKCPWIQMSPSCRPLPAQVSRALLWHRLLWLGSELSHASALACEQG